MATQSAVVSVTLSTAAAAVKSAFYTAAKADNKLAVTFGRMFEANTPATFGAELAAIFASVAADGHATIKADSFRKAADRHTAPGTTIGAHLLAKPVWLIDKADGTARVVCLSDSCGLSDVAAAKLPTREQNKMVGAWIAKRHTGASAAALAAAEAAAVAALTAGQSGAEAEAAAAAAVEMLASLPAPVVAEAEAAADDADTVRTAEAEAATDNGAQLLAMLASLSDVALAEVAAAVVAEQAKRAERAAPAAETATAAHGSNASELPATALATAFAGAKQGKGKAKAA